jgi:N-acetyl-anhydromuramyl-L-alanine amidase AmpD
MPSPRELTYLSHNLFVDYELLERMSPPDVSQSIEAIRKVYRDESDAMARHRALKEIGRRITAHYEVKGCPTCHKPTEPINSPQSCSC